MATWKFRRGKWRRINVEFSEQMQKTILLSATIRAILDNDKNATNPTGLSPEEQKEAIQDLPGMTATEMQSIIIATGPALADSIRAVISVHRARNDRSNKDRFK